MTQKLLTLSDKIRKALDLPQVINIIDQLPHNPTVKWPKRNFSLLQGITVHHFASEAPIVNQANYHINVHGWAGIAYAVIIRDGQIFQTNYLDDRTTHASGGNDISFGVCIGGDLSKRSITDFERRALTGILMGLKELFPNLWVKGHNQISKTSCPCTNMDKIRGDLMAAEQQAIQAESAPKKEEIAYRIMNQMSYFYNLSKGLLPDKSPATDGQKAWGLNMILSMEDEFRKNGFLK